MKGRYVIFVALALAAAGAVAFASRSASLEVRLGTFLGDRARTGEGSLASAAERLFRRALALAPESEEAHAFYGRWLFQQKRFPEAIGQLKQAVVLNPAHLLQRDLLIRAETAVGDHGGAQHAAMDTLHLAPGDPVALAAIPKPRERTAADWVRLSGIQYRQGQYPRSIEAAERAIVLDPGNAEAYNNIGAAYAAMGQWDEAIRYEQDAIAIRSDFQLARNNLMWALSQKAAHRSAGE